MLMHGGGFKPEDDFSNKNQWITLCRLLAKRGFVAATIDYRVGWTDRNKRWPDYTPEEKKNPSGIYAIYRAYQDGRAALRYFVHNASLFGIDTNNIFVGGRSAGGDMSIALAFYDQHDVDSVLATVVPNNCHKMFGGLDSSTNNFTNKFKLRGIANMWGPIFDTAMISKEEAQAMPMIMFHGTDDQSVTYKRWDTNNFPFIIYGSYYIAQRYRNIGACYQLNTKVGGGHGEDFSNEFLAEHMSAFFKNVMCNNCKSEEFESKVSFYWKIKLFFESDAWLNVIPVIVLILIIFFIIKRIKKRKNSSV
jgi:predicted esterase